MLITNNIILTEQDIIKHVNSASKYAKIAYPSIIILSILFPVLLCLSIKGNKITESGYLAGTYFTLAIATILANINTGMCSLGSEYNGIKVSHHATTITAIRILIALLGVMYIFITEQKDIAPKYVLGNASLVSILLIIHAELCRQAINTQKEYWSQFRTKPKAKIVNVKRAKIPEIESIREVKINKEKPKIKRKKLKKIDTIDEDDEAQTSRKISKRKRINTINDEEPEIKKIPKVKRIERTDEEDDEDIDESEDIDEDLE